MITRSLIGLLTLVCAAQAHPNCRAWNPGPIASSARPVAGTTKLCVGQLLQARWGNRWWAARIVVLRANRVRIHYVGWASSWDEEVARDRLQLPSRPRILRRGEAVLVHWGNRWWDGQVKGTRPDGRIDITYVGWDDIWDESVERSRIRLP